MWSSFILIILDLAVSFSFCWKILFFLHFRLNYPFNIIIITLLLPKTFKGFFALVSALVILFNRWNLPLQVRHLYFDLINLSILLRVPWRALTYKKSLTLRCECGREPTSWCSLAVRENRFSTPPRTCWPVMPGSRLILHSCRRMRSRTGGKEL